MIERAAVYLENGCQRLLRVHKKALRPQRSLHSGFWCHGAGNIDLPAWWISFLQMPQVNKGDWLPRGSRADANIILSNIRQLTFLDFLYPTQTLTIIQRFVKKDRISLNPHHQARNILHPSRAYASVATVTAHRTETTPRLQHIVNGSLSEKGGLISHQHFESHEISNGLGAKLNKLLKIAGVHASQEVWHCYRNLRKFSREELSSREIAKLLRYLSLSPIACTVERITAVIDGIPQRSRRAIHYRFAVSGALSHGDYEAAVAFHREACSRFQGSVGTALLLRYAIVGERWKEAIEIYNDYRDRTRLNFQPPEIWTSVKASIPFELLIERAASVADFAMGTSAEASTETAVLGREFALQMIQKVFSVQAVSIDVIKHQKLFWKAIDLKEPTLGLYKAAISQLLAIKGQGPRGVAFGYYLRLKQHPHLTPDKPLLNAMLAMFTSIHSDSGIRLVYDDYRTYHAAAPLANVEATIDEASSRGSIKLIWSILDQYHHVLRGPMRQRICYLILNAYCKRGEIDNVVRYFQSLQDEHGFIPDLKSWNIVIATHARVGDVDGALMWFDKLIEAGMQPDNYSYHPLMAMYANRGDAEAVVQLLEDTEAAGMKPSVAMISSVVLAYTKIDQLEAACGLVEKASRMDMTGSRTRMWNHVIHAYALRRDIEKVADMRKRMLENGVQPDSMTYAAIMHSLHTLHPTAAWKILRKVMPRAGVPAHNIHYAICLIGFLATREYDLLSEVYKHMLQHGLGPTFVEQRMLLIAAARIDRHRMKDFPSDQVKVKLAESMLDKISPAMDLKEFVADEPIKLLGGNRLDEAYSSAYFSHMIHVYGRQRCFDKVAEIYDRYLATRKKFRQGMNASMNASPPPVEMLRALMAANLTAGDHGEVERCWYLALDKAKSITRRRNADTSDPGWVLHNRRLIMNPCLSWYMNSLEMQNRIDDVSATVDELRRSGYELDHQCWNQYVKTLARNDRGLLAFEVCERELMDKWPGWDSLGAPEGQPRRLGRKIPKRRTPGPRLPKYYTLVYLAKAYLEMGSHEKEDLAKVAPRITDVIRDMPYHVKQEKILGTT